MWSECTVVVALIVRWREISLFTRVTAIGGEYDIVYTRTRFDYNYVHSDAIVLTEKPRPWRRAKASYRPPPR